MPQIVKQPFSSLPPPVYAFSAMRTASDSSSGDDPPGDVVFAAGVVALVVRSRAGDDADSEAHDAGAPVAARSSL
jgi:hypothetical protein